MVHTNFNHDKMKIFFSFLINIKKNRLFSDINKSIDSMNVVMMMMKVNQTKNQNKNQIALK